jgi:hypothetical protein
MCEIYTDNYIISNDFTNYELGYKTGWRDAELISNSHTYEQFISIKNLYEDAILSIDEWSRGYAQGFDDWCLRNRH